MFVYRSNRAYDIESALLCLQTTFASLLDRFDSIRLIMN